MHGPALAPRSRPWVWGAPLGNVEINCFTVASLCMHVLSKKVNPFVILAVVALSSWTHIYTPALSSESRHTRLDSATGPKYHVDVIGTAQALCDLHARPMQVPEVSRRSGPGARRGDPAVANGALRLSFVPQHSFEQAKAHGVLGILGYPCSRFAVVVFAGLRTEIDELLPHVGQADKLGNLY